MGADVSGIIVAGPGSGCSGPHYAPHARQGFDDYVVVAVNDASDDATVELLQQYRQCDPRRLHKPAPDRGNALNHGLAQARGGFITRMDGVPLQPPQWLLEHAVKPVVLVCIARHGTRTEVAAWLQQHDLRPERDYHQRE